MNSDLKDTVPSQDPNLAEALLYDTIKDSKEDYIDVAYSDNAEERALKRSLLEKKIKEGYLLYRILLWGFMIISLALSIYLIIVYIKEYPYVVIITIILILNEIRRITYKGLQAINGQNLEKQNWCIIRYIGYLTVIPLASVAGIIFYPDYTFIIIAAVIGVLIYFGVLLYEGHKLKVDLTMKKNMELS